MENKVLIGKIEKVDRISKFGIVVEASDSTSQGSSGSAYFTLDDDLNKLEVGQTVQFVIEKSAAGPEAKRIMVLRPPEV